VLIIPALAPPRSAGVRQGYPAGDDAACALAQGCPGGHGVSDPACGDGDDGRSRESKAGGPKIADPGPIHVHGLGINPKDGAVFIATHTGLFRAPEGGRKARRVANRFQDTMSFMVVGPDRL
jgi:hypothetical protein